MDRGKIVRYSECLAYAIRRNGQEKDERTVKYYRMYSVVQRDAGREVEHGKDRKKKESEQSSGQTKGSLFRAVVFRSKTNVKKQNKGRTTKEGQSKRQRRRSQVGQAKLGWCVFVHDQKVLPAVSAGRHKRSEMYRGTCTRSLFTKNCCRLLCPESSYHGPKYQM